jgi:hypothetical protein
MVPTVAHQEQICNFGYARGRCEHFPADAMVDAVRFSVKQDAGEPPTDLLRVIYVLERDHAPVEHGVLTFSGSSTAPSLNGVPMPSNLLLTAQAEAFVVSYRRQRASVAV